MRSFDWSGPKIVDDHLTVTTHPAQTSFGAVSMQLRTAAETVGLDPASLTTSDMRKLSACLGSDVYNLALVAKHLRALLTHEFPGIRTASPTPEQIKIAGARYNRGTGLTLAAIKRNTSYGDVLLKIWPRMTSLLRG